MNRPPRAWWSRLSYHLGDFFWGVLSWGRGSSSPPARIPGRAHVVQDRRPAPAPSDHLRHHFVRIVNGHFTQHLQGFLVPYSSRFLGHWLLSNVTLGLMRIVSSNVTRIVSRNYPSDYLFLFFLFFFMRIVTVSLPQFFFFAGYL
jgi:hypothetical protein